MVTPARPVDDAIIETGWGQWAHDAILTVSGLPHARVGRAAAQSIPNAVGTPISFDTQYEDLGDLWAPGAPTRLSITAAGFYLFGCSAYWAVSTAGNRRMLQLHVNAVPVAVVSQAPHAGGGIGQTIMTGYYLAAGSYIECQAFQDAGVALGIGGGAAYDVEIWAAAVASARLPLDSAVTLRGMTTDTPACFDPDYAAIAAALRELANARGLLPNEKRLLTLASFALAQAETDRSEFLSNMALQHALWAEQTARAESAERAVAELAGRLEADEAGRG